MPFVTVSSNVKTTSVDKQAVLAAISQTLSGSLGRDEAYVMVHLMLDQELVFDKTSSSPTAFIHVRYLGPKTEADLYADLTAVVATRLHVAPERVFISVENVSTWGWNGKPVKL